MHVGATASSTTTVCPVALISSVLIFPQAVHVKVFIPVLVQVGAVVTSPSFHVCSLTFTFTTACTPSTTDLTVTMVSPTDTADTFPFSSTVATLSSPDTYVSCLFSAFSGNTVAVIVAVFPTHISIESVSISTFAA